MIFLRTLLLLTLGAASTVAVADSFNFGVSNNSVTAAYDVELSKSFNIKTSLLHTDVDKARIEPSHTRKIRRDTTTDMVNFGVFNGGQVGPVRLYVGGELFWLHTRISKVKKSRDQTYGLSLGGGIHAIIIPNLYMDGQILYAPDILTNGDHQSVLQFNTSIGYQIIKNTSLYAAYRYIHTTGKEWDMRPYNGPVIGFKFSF